MVDEAVLERPRVEMPQANQNNVVSYIQNWQQRIQDLYEQVRSCAGDSADLSFSEEMTANLYEKPMYDCGLGPVKLPVLNIHRKNDFVASFQPIGLWVLGANGRIDILTKEGTFELIDEAEVGKPPIWQVFAPKSWEAKPFDNEVVERLLS